jgi:hypothetical protein
MSVLRKLSSIPPDIYERVHELAVAIVNATVAGDNTLDESLRQTMRSYFDELACSDRSHPFLTEAMADHTHNPAEAARLYELALEQARAFPEEPTHTKMICLAERLVELGRSEQAKAYLRDGRTEAVRRNDTYWIQEADALLQKLNA